jgi:hypothetical protein
VAAGFLGADARVVEQGAGRGDGEVKAGLAADPSVLYPQVAAAG